MLGGIIPKVFPEVIAQSVFGADLCQIPFRIVRFCCFTAVLGMQYRSHPRFAFNRKLQVRPVESTFFAEANEHDPFTVLGKKMTCV